LPPGRVNLVIGPTAPTYAPIMASPAVRKVSLTGSTAGRPADDPRCRRYREAVSMELGGNAPLIVFEDADLDQVLERVRAGTKFANAGQVCVTPDRFYRARERCTTPFVDGFVARAKASEARRWSRSETSQMGPLINQRRLDAIEAIVADAQVERRKDQRCRRQPAGRTTAGISSSRPCSPACPTTPGLRRGEFRPHRRHHPLCCRPTKLMSAPTASSMGLSAYVFTRSPHARGGGAA
jgi:succinate-semialdehyde dehydrogenase/glutarate-semialdehyde dehydrogenase